ncbi:MAG: UDP-N-acetylmuramate dehydrogenase [Candidatus Pacebacteria bacterium]|nr:UDP-N-acetylmuramate dehydrogenase [Candidatus Paceibacterota bacterium]
MTKTQKLLATNLLRFDFKFNQPLAPLSYFKLGGPAEAYLKLTDLDQIITVARFCQQHQVKLTILGGGSNVIIADQGVQGLVLHLAADRLKTLKSDQPGYQVLQAQAGLKTSVLVSRSVKLGLTGLEYFLGVPGTVGGAVYNNAHYLEDLIGKHVKQVQVLTPQGKLEWLSQAQCDFAYDSSRFHHTQEIILQVDFLLAQGDRATSQELIREANTYRQKTQPLNLPSSGCVFQNVPNTAKLKKLFPQFKKRNFVPAGFLIDQAGLKGVKQGDIQVSDKHAAFMVNLGQGTTKDLKKLIKKVQERVKKRFGVQLTEEVFYLS